MKLVFLICILLTTTAINAEPAVTYYDPHARALPQICLLPADVEVKKITFKGTVPLPKESERWATKIDDALIQVFTEVGAAPVGISSAQLDSHEDLRQSLTQLIQKYRTIEPKITSKPEDIAKSRYTIGDEISTLPCTGQAAAVVFVRASIYEIRSVNPYGRRPESALWLSFVDARSGGIVGLMNVSLERVGFRSHLAQSLTENMESGLAKLRVGKYVAYIDKTGSH